MKRDYLKLHDDEKKELDKYRIVRWLWQFLCSLCNRRTEKEKENEEGEGKGSEKENGNDLLDRWGVELPPLLPFPLFFLEKETKGGTEEAGGE